MTKLLLGGGTLTKPGFTNIDILDLPGVDIVHDIQTGIPFDDNSVDMVLADNSFMYFHDVQFVMEEIWRVCKPNAMVVIKVPYYMSESGFKDIADVKRFTERTFEHFDRSYVERGLLPEYNIKCNFKMDKPVTFNYYRRGVRFIPFIWFWRRCFWNIVRTIVFELRVIK
jgi:SAM-dependent methyltransferase